MEWFSLCCGVIIFQLALALRVASYQLSVAGYSNRLLA
jgi:hypothetical protein